MNGAGFSLPQGSPLGDWKVTERRYMAVERNISTMPDFTLFGIFRTSRAAGYPDCIVSGDLLHDFGLEPGPHYPDQDEVTPPLPHGFLSWLLVLCCYLTHLLHHP